MIRIVYVLFALVACTTTSGDPCATRTDGETMSLPSSRNTTYAPGSQVLSADLNDLQDCIIGGNHGDVWRWISPISAVKTSGASDATRTIGTGLKATAASVYELPIDVPVGSRIKALQIRYRGANLGPGVLTVYLEWSKADNSDDSYYSTEYIDINDGDTDSHTSAICTFGTPITVVDPGSIGAAAAAAPAININMGNGQQVFSVGYLIDNPLP